VVLVWGLFEISRNKTHIILKKTYKRRKVVNHGHKMGKVKRTIYTRNRYQILKQIKNQVRSNDRREYKCCAHAPAPESLENRNGIIQNHICFLNSIIKEIKHA
jgi:hypothetical protein